VNAITIAVQIEEENQGNWPIDEPKLPKELLKTKIYKIKIELIFLTSLYL
jgi:hypothetical protein